MLYLFVLQASVVLYRDVVRGGIDQVFVLVECQCERGLAVGNPDVIGQLEGSAVGIAKLGHLEAASVPVIDTQRPGVCGVRPGAIIDLFYKPGDGLEPKVIIRRVCSRR